MCYLTASYILLPLYYHYSSRFYQKMAIYSSRFCQKTGNYSSQFYQKKLQVSKKQYITITHSQSNTAKQESR